MSDFSRENQAHIIAVANQKGGVGKTTTAINLAAGLVELGATVLLIDLDPQGNASTGLGIATDARRATTYDILIEDRPMTEVIQKTEIANLWICPANSDLASADIDLVANEKRIFLLHDALREPALEALEFDFVLIDCPPSLSLLTVNAFVSAHAVLVPLQAEFYALEGLSQLMLTVRKIRTTATPVCVLKAW